MLTTVLANSDAAMNNNKITKREKLESFLDNNGANTSQNRQVINGNKVKKAWEVI